MHWLKGSTNPETAEKPFGQGRFDDEGDPPSSRRSSVVVAAPRVSVTGAGAAGRTVVPAKRVSVTDRSAPAPPTFSFHNKAPPPPAEHDGKDDLRSFVTESIDRLSVQMEEQLEHFRKALEELQSKQEKEMQKVHVGVKHNSDLVKRAQLASQNAVEELQKMEETVRENVFDHAAFSTLQAQVQEAVQYLDEESQRRIGRLTVQQQRLTFVVKKSVARTCQDYKDLDIRLTLQSLAASTFALKATVMQEEHRAKSLKYLEGEENRVKGLMKQSSPRARMAEEEILEELSKDLPPKPHLQRPSLLGGPGMLAPAEEARQQTRGLLELLSAEVFCLNAMTYDDFTRKMCVEMLKRRATELRSPTTTAAALEAINSEALSAANSDSIPAEIDKPLQVAAIEHRISFTERL